MQKLEKFSISRIRCFENCQWAYKLQHVDRVEIKEKALSSAAQFGNLIHHCAEFNIFDPEKAKEIASQYAPITNDDLNKNLVPNLMAVKNYIESVNAQYPTIPSNEKYLRWDGKDFNLVAKLDRICQKDNSFKIIDYKTGKNIDDAKSCEEQLKFYDMMIRFWVKNTLKIAKIDNITCELFFTRHDKAISYNFNFDQITDFARNIKSRIENIRSTTKFFPNPSRWNCSCCSYKNDKSLCKNSCY